jgi:SAM-dependent methyltransferase
MARMNDALGTAIAAYQHTKSAATLWIHNKYGPKESMPVNTYFRGYDTMPELEQAALEACTGSVLDIGAGAGSHTLVLQQWQQEVTALDISPLCCDVMRLRGVKQVICANALALAPASRYDTLLMLMNGIGFTGTLAGLRSFMQYARVLLNPGGQLLLDSSDVAYVYEYGLPDPAHYYGEIPYRYQYGRIKTDWFNWLYIDRFTLAALAQEAGFSFLLLYEDSFGQYLVRLQPV